MPKIQWSRECVFCKNSLCHTSKEHSYAVRVELDRLAAIEKRKTERKAKTKMAKQDLLINSRKRERPGIYSEIEEGIND